MTEKLADKLGVLAPSLRTALSRMDTDALIGKVITRSHAIGKLLRKHYPTARGGLHSAINGLADTLPAILVRAIRVVAIVRNAAAHPNGFKPNTVPSDFNRLCDEIELLIPYFANQQHAKPAQPPKKPRPPAPKPQTKASSKPQNNGHATNVPGSRGKPWTAGKKRDM